MISKQVFFQQLLCGWMAVCFAHFLNIEFLEKQVFYKVV